MSKEIKAVVRSADAGGEWELGVFPPDQIQPLVEAFRSVPDLWADGEYRLHRIQWILEPDCDPELEIVVTP